MTQERWNTSVDELARIFRGALVALIPTAERARMPWREPNNDDDWDAIAVALYESIVLRSLENAGEWDKFHTVLKYDKRIDTYSNNSFLTMKDQPGTVAFICFETEFSPFDTCLFGR